MARVEPNAAHHALARLDAEWPGELLIVTQNVDDLHERAGATRLLHMHGELLSALCADCGARQRVGGRHAAGHACAACGVRRRCGPDIVFFGEMPYAMDGSRRRCRACDLFVSIGTSGAVYPAAGFVQTRAITARATLELNLEPLGGQRLFDESRLGPGGRIWCRRGSRRRCALATRQSTQSSPMSR